MLASPNNTAKCSGEFIQLEGQDFYVIKNYEQLQPFFMSIVSPDDHWLFISSTGGLTAGRKDANNALFPYYTVDKVTENFNNTGSKTLVWAELAGEQYLWEPFMPHGAFKISRQLYKNRAGNQLIFAEDNLDLGLSFRVLWTFSTKFGLVRKSSLHSRRKQHVRILDGLQNLLAAGIYQKIQNEMSNLLDAYKKNEQYENLLALFTLSSILSDKASPSESLLATSVWSSLGEARSLLLSSAQISSFRRKKKLQNELDVRAQRAAYLLEQSLELEEGATRTWYTVCELRQNHSSILALAERLKHKSLLVEELRADIEEGTQRLNQIVGAADGIQYTADRKSSMHHFANVLFNNMRGGYFAYGYDLPIFDFLDFISKRNARLLAGTGGQRVQRLLQELQVHNAKKQAERDDLVPMGLVLDLCKQAKDVNLLRLYYEYLPLTFSRRHGDPSRPWNRFAIDLYEDTGRKKLYYEGNWRDIFQNWESLCLSFPKFIKNIIVKFLNASTADGYNPYRLTRTGIDWEVPKPSDPWANIGYWGDHQIIYLLKLLEWCKNFDPRDFADLVEQNIFSYANVPYRIRSFEKLVDNPKDSISFAADLDQEIKARQASFGADAKLLWLPQEASVYHVSFTEKLLLTVLSKLANMIPGAGIWLNTQRPEWNDANNALVGGGVSLVTLCYLRRFLAFWRESYADIEVAEFIISNRVLAFWRKIRSALQGTDKQELFRQLNIAGSDYRAALYLEGADPNFGRLRKDDLIAFLCEALERVESYIDENKRSDGLYHSYNLLYLTRDKNAPVQFTTTHLYEMLEGQVAVLSAGQLDSRAAISLLRVLRESKLYRADQKAYMLYPYRYFPKFMEKNLITKLPAKFSAAVDILQQSQILKQDLAGNWHFNASFRSKADLEKQFREDPALAELDLADLLELYEDVFQHKDFTGRSGAFFAYEGLGSIYWHMVSKLLVAVGENIARAASKSLEEQELQAIYYELRDGLGFNKSPEEQGAFPLDPYSHTPWNHAQGSSAKIGAKQPGMTGQVKEEILTRFRELGLEVKNGQLLLKPNLLRIGEFFAERGQVCTYYNTEGNLQELILAEQSLMFSFAQVPFIYKLVPGASQIVIAVYWEDGRVQNSKGPVFPPEVFASLQHRAGLLQRIELVLAPQLLYVPQ